MKKCDWLLPGESNRMQDEENPNIYMVDRIKGRSFQDVLEDRTSTGENPDPNDPTKTIEVITVKRTITSRTTY